MYFEGGNNNSNNITLFIKGNKSVYSNNEGKLNGGAIYAKNIGV